MNTFLLVWNPKRWQWDDLLVVKHKIDSGEIVTQDWSCGTTKKIGVGDRVFLIRLGIEPKGIFASGYVEEERHLGKHWDPEENREIWYVKVKFDKVMNPESDKIILRSDLELSQFQPMHWDSQMSGVQIPSDIADKVEEAWES